MKSVLKISNYLKTCSTSLPGARSTSLSTLNSFQGMSKVNICNSTEFNICSQMANTLGKYQFVVGIIIIFKGETVFLSND